MGTGSFTPNPSGPGGALGMGLLRKLNNITTADKKLVEIKNASQEVFKKLVSHPFFYSKIADPSLNEVYNAIFDLTFAVFQKKDWKSIEDEYGVSGESGCLHRWAKVIAEKIPDTVVSRGQIRDTLDKFLLNSLNNDLRAYVAGDSKKIISDMSNKAFKSTSAIFLSTILAESVKGQIQGVNNLDNELVKKAATQKANQIVANFESQFSNRSYGDINQVSYRNLFDVIQKEKDWFLKQISKKF